MFTQMATEKEFQEQGKCGGGGGTVKLPDPIACACDVCWLWCWCSDAATIITEEIITSEISAVVVDVAGV